MVSDGMNPSDEAEWARRSTTRNMRSLARDVTRGRAPVISGLRRVSDVLEEDSEGDYLMVIAIGARIDEERGFSTRSTKTEPLLGPSLFDQRTLLPLTKTTRNAFSHMITLGRSENNDLIVPFAQISKLHAYFSKDERGWSIRDCGSSNGTKVSGKPLEPKVSEPLHDGAEIVLGRVIAVQLLTYARVQQYSAFLKQMNPGEPP